MNRRMRRVRTWMLLAAALFCVGAGLALQAADALRRLDLGTIDARFDARGARPTPEDVVIVGIDDKTLTAPSHIFPYSRKFHARVIRNLAKADAKVIAYDVQFTQESPNPNADFALITAVRRAAPRVVLATNAVGAGGVTQIFGGGRGLRFSRARPAFSAFEKDPDGVQRRLLYSENDLKAFPVAAAEQFTGREIAPPPDGADWIDFEGGPATFQEISFVDVEEGNFDPADVRGKIVVVGATASILQDIRETSTTNQRAMAGPEVQANAITTAIAGFPLRSAPHWVDVLLVIVLGALAPLAAIRLRMLFVVPLGIAAIAGLVIGAQLAFEENVIFSFAYALVAGVAALLLTGAIHGITVAFERAHTHEAFARFVPEAVVDEVLEGRRDLRLGGVRARGHGHVQRPARLHDLRRGRSRRTRSSTP